ncbi:hypothetical protein R6Z07F_012214 [Ovis aries]
MFTTPSSQALEKCKDAGLTKSIGVSNFNHKQLEKILNKLGLKYKPVCNQVECHPYLNQRKLLDFCKSHEIVLLLSISEIPSRVNPNHPVLLEDPVLSAIAQKHKKTAALVALRYQIQRGVVVLAKGNNKKWIKENMQVFEFELTPEDMKAIDGLNRNIRYYEFHLFYSCPIAHSKWFFSTHLSPDPGEDAGLTKSIGVSNFNHKQLEKILNKPGLKYKPICNQVECHPYLSQRKLLDFCKSHDIVLVAYAALGSQRLKEWVNLGLPVLLEDPVLCPIAKKHKQTPALVALLYQTQRGVVVLAKSYNKKRIKENIQGTGAGSAPPPAQAGSRRRSVSQHHLESSLGLQGEAGWLATKEQHYPHRAPHLPSGHPRAGSGLENRDTDAEAGALCLGVWPLEPGKGTKRVEFTHTTFPGERSCRDGCWEPGSPSLRLRDPREGPAALSPPVHPTRGPCQPARGPERSTDPAPKGERTLVPHKRTASCTPRRPADKACTGASTPWPHLMVLITFAK